MKRIISAVLLLVMCCALLTGCFCKHEWQDATCTEPITCSLCGKTEGSASGHVEGEMVTGEINFEAKTVTSYQQCKICDEYLHHEESALTSMVSGGKFVFTPNQYNDAMNAYFGGDYSFTIDALDSGSLISMIYDAANNIVGAIMYLTGSEGLTMADVDSTNCDGFICYWYTDDNAQIIDAMQGIMCGCDISFTEDTALEVLSATIDAYGSDYYHNGLSYEVTLNDNDFVFFIRIG